MKLIGGLVALAIGLGLTVVYFSLAKFFAANARALHRNEKGAEQIPIEPRRTQVQPKESLEALRKSEIETAAKAER